MNQSFMQEAIQQALHARDQGEVPIGAIVVWKQGILTVTHNLVEHYQDPTAHAEMLAIRQACTLLGTRFLEDCSLYVTLEPCPMCAQAISFARFKSLYFGAYDIKGGGVDHGPQLYHQKSCFHKPEVYGGLREQDCKNLLQEFFKDRR